MSYIKDFLRMLYYFKTYRRFKECGKNVILSKGGIIFRANEISIGENVFISRNFHISARNLKIGNNIMIGPNLVIECDNHIFSKPGVTMFEISNERNIGSVTIEDDVWIGANVTILPNSFISEGCVIGAGSIVTKTMPPYSVCYGSPCLPIKPRFTLPELSEHLDLVDSTYSLDVIKETWKGYILI